MTHFEVKDSGKRHEFDSGMVRDVTEGKIDWSLVADGPLLRRLAVHLTKGAVKYTPRNWMLARGEAERGRFKESAFRHFMQWYYGDTDEDHFAATVFNMNGKEYVEAHLEPSPDDQAPALQGDLWAGTLGSPPNPARGERLLRLVRLA